MAGSSLRQRIGRLFEDEDQIILVDYLLLILALASVVILFLERTITLTAQEQLLLRYVDMAAQVLFALGFVGKVLTSARPVETATHRWPELIGAMPLTVPFLVQERYYVVVQALVILTRLSIGLDRNLGERALYRLFDRYRDAVVEELTDPILVRITLITQNIIRKGSYAASVGESIEERREDVHGAVRKAIDSDARLKRLLRIPGIPNLVDETVDAAVDATVASLTSEEMDRIVRSTLDQVFDDFRRRVDEKEWKEEGIGFKQVAGAVRRSHGGTPGGEAERRGADRSPPGGGKGSGNPGGGPGSPPNP